MIITVASYKGGVGKTTTAVHLAAYLNTLAPTILFDGDQGTKNATGWARRNGGFPFRVALIEQASKLARDFAHVVIDTGQRPSSDDMQAAAEGSDLVVVPAVPGWLDTDGLGQTVRALQQVQSASAGGGCRFRVLLTKVPPDAARQALELRALLADEGVDVFKTEIPRLKAFDKAVGAGAIVDQVKDDVNAGRAWAAYEAAGKELFA